MYVRLSVLSLSLYLYMCIYISVCLSVRQSVNPPVCLPVSLPVSFDTRRSNFECFDWVLASWVTYHTNTRHLRCRLVMGRGKSVLSSSVVGVSYLIDNLSGACQWSAVKDSAMAFYKNVNSQQVRMETPREFFMDSNINYQYAGSVSAWSWCLGICTSLPSLWCNRAD